MPYDLDTRLAEMPVIARRDDFLDADVFNLWRRARLRLGSPIRLTGLGLKQIEMVLTDTQGVSFPCSRLRRKAASLDGIQ